MSNRNSHGGPSVTFGGYVKPETVKESHINVDQQIDTKPLMPPPCFHFDPIRSYQGSSDTKHELPFDPQMLTIGLTVVLTFVLGVLTTVYFATGRQPDLASAVEAPGNDAPRALAQVVSASLEQAVSRSNTGDLITPTGAMSRADPNALTMSEILRGLSPTASADSLSNQESARKEEQNILSRNKLRLLREGVLAGNYTIKAVKRNGQDRLCLRMPNANVTQDEAAELLEQAAARGEIILPQSLSTAEGNFDADTLIFNLVQTSLANDGTIEGAEAAKEMSRRAFAASNARTSKVNGERVYIVRPGDSLAYLSLQFYGKPSDYEKIFVANRPLLRSPDKIQIGQHLKIPS